MFPGVDGFHWTVGHVVFLSLFFLVASTIFATVLRAAWHTVRELDTHKAAELCWKTAFAELPEAERRCRHELAGRVGSRMCDNAFDCRHCRNYSHFASLAAKAPANDFGISFAPDRFYHRGHTWVGVGEDDILTVGLDELADHLIGKPDSLELPPVGREVELNGMAWRMQKGGREIRVRAPIEGTVVAVGDAKAGWYLKIRPRKNPHDPAALRHLLHATEVGGWLAREIDRLLPQLSEPSVLTTLADGGYALSRLRLSMLMVSGIVSISLYLFTAATMARPMPVLPLVGSIIVVSGLIKPCFSASVIMLKQMRSFTLPPGFLDSSFATTVAFMPWVSWFSFTSGVFPMVSKTLL